MTQKKREETEKRRDVEEKGSRRKGKPTDKIFVL